MAGLIESATAILSASEKRVEAASRNVANASTAGFKKQVGVFQIVKDGGTSIGARTGSPKTMAARTGPAAMRGTIKAI